jgi:hypothetical protein
MSVTAAISWFAVGELGKACTSNENPKTNMLAAAAKATFIDFPLSGLTDLGGSSPGSTGALKTERLGPANTPPERHAAAHQTPSDVFAARGMSIIQIRRKSGGPDWSGPYYQYGHL